MDRPSLIGPLARIDRAAVHINDLELLIDKFRKANEDEIVAQRELIAREMKRGQKVVSPCYPLPIAIGEVIPIVAGEVIYNLRAALDYLIYELAWKDSGRKQDYTQFLIEESKSRFDSRKEKYLAGVNDLHRDSIELLQPYKGTDWTKTLREISNPDKHRRITPIISLSGAWSFMEKGPAGSFEDRPGKILRGIGESGTEVYHDSQYSIDVAFPDRIPLVETLKILQRKVAETIDSFKSEFQ